MKRKFVPNKKTLQDAKATGGLFGGKSLDADDIIRKQLEKQLEDNRELIEKYATILNYDYKTSLVTFECKKDKNVETLFLGTILDKIERNMLICTLCFFPKEQTEKHKNEMYEFLKDTYEQNNIKSEIIRDYKIDEKNEIDLYRTVDFYLPEFKLAIDLPNIYLHSNRFHDDMKFHRKKKELCHQQGINLVNIWEDDWIIKPETCKSRLVHRFNKTGRTVYARKCYIKEVDAQTYDEFMIDSHFQGHYATGSRGYGLYLKDTNELVSVMVFRQEENRVTRENIHYLARFANTKGFNVVGAFSKLQAQYIKDENPPYLISYADHDWSDLENNVYAKNGYEYVDYSIRYCGFDYIDKFKRPWENFKWNRLYDNKQYNFKALYPFNNTEMMTGNDVLKGIGCYLINLNSISKYRLDCNKIN